MKKKVVIIISVIVFLVLLIGLVIGININNKIKIMNDNMIVIQKEYDKIRDNVLEYNNIRSEYLDLTNDFYYETFMDKYQEYTSLLDRYDKVIDKIDNSILEIDKKCNIVYKDDNTNKICNSYKKLYEKIINLYVMDGNNYNKRVEGYNSYKNDSIELHDIKYKDYIDYNNDNKYEGIDSNEEDN